MGEGGGGGMTRCFFQVSFVVLLESEKKKRQIEKKKKKKANICISVLHGELLKAFPLKLGMKQDACNPLLYLTLFWRNGNQEKNKLKVLNQKRKGNSIHYLLIL